MGRISSTTLLALVLVIGASAQPKGKGKGGDDPIAAPEPNSVVELAVAGAGVALLAVLLRRQMKS